MITLLHLQEPVLPIQISYFSQQANVTPVTQNSPISIPTCITTSEIVTINNHDYILYDVPGDGDCFFHCLSLVKYGDFSMTAYYRYVICTEVFSSWLTLKDHIDLCHNFSPNTPDKYKESMLLGNAWASAVEVDTCSALFQSSFKIFVNSGNPGQVLQCHQVDVLNLNSTFTFHLLLSGNHYKLLVPFDTTSAEYALYLACKNSSILYTSPYPCESLAQKRLRTNRLHKKLYKIKHTNTNPQTTTQSSQTKRAAATTTNSHSSQPKRIRPSTEPSVTANTSTEVLIANGPISEIPDNAINCIKAFEQKQMSYNINSCLVCEEQRIEMKMKEQNCIRCAKDKKEVKMFSKENNMNPGVVPPELMNMTVVEQNLISRLSPCMNIHMLKHGGIAASGHCVTFPQNINEPCHILPNLPQSLSILRLRKKGKNDTSKDFRVRRLTVQNALVWLKQNNPAFADIEISQDRLNALPEDGEVSVRNLEYTDDVVRQNDKGPAPDQIIDTDGELSSVSGVLAPEPNINIAEKIDQVLDEVAGPDHPRCTTNRRGDLIVPWPTRDVTPISEFMTHNFFTLSFPCLFPYASGDFFALRPRTCLSMKDWAEHLLWFKDGRFAHHPFFKFVVHNMIIRKQTLEQGSFIARQKLGDPHLSITDLQQMLDSGTAAIAKKILYFASNIRGTSQYWVQRSQELRSLIQFKIDSGEGIPSYFGTGSCAEFHFKPLMRLLRLYIEEGTGKSIDLSNRSNVFTALQENSHVVAQYFQLRTDSYIEEVMKPLFGIDTFWIRYEFAKSRGMVHWHGLFWRPDKEPHKTMFEQMTNGASEEQLADVLSEWAKKYLGMTACHPAGKDQNGNPRKEFWPPPEGTAAAPAEDRNPLVKLLSDVGDDQTNLLEDYLLISNRVNIHRCSDYCLRKPRRGSEEKMCRMEFGKASNPGKILRDNPALIKDKNGCLRLEMARDHPLMVQNSRFHTQGWRANGDISLLVSKSDPSDPSVNDIIGVERYVCGYACKGNEGTGALVDLFQDMTNSADDASLPAKSVCNKFLMSTVKRDISAVEASFELTSIPLYRCSHKFKTISLSGSRQLEQKGHTMTKSTPLDKYLARSEHDHTSFYKFSRGCRTVPVVVGGCVRATWPLIEDYCRNMLLLHWPSWFKIIDIKPDDRSWSEMFLSFLETDACPNFVRADVERAKSSIDPTPCEDTGEDADNQIDTDNDPDWVAMVQPNALYEETTEEFDYDDGGPSHDWSTHQNEYPSDLGVSWMDTVIQQYSIVSENVEMIIPQVDLGSLNSDQQFAFNIILQTLIDYKEKSDRFKPLHLIITGSAGSGKSYVIKCLVKAIRLLFNRNSAVQVLCPTGSSANLISGVTLHSFLKIPTSKKVKEMKPPDGVNGVTLQDNCKGLEALLIDERSLIGCRTLGWMEYLCKCGMQNQSSLWGGIPVVVFFGDDIQLPPVADSPVYNCNSTSDVARHGYLVWQKFENSVALTTVVRQSDNEKNLRDSLFSLRQYSLSSEQAKWLQDFHYHKLKVSHGEALLKRMDEHGLFIFPNHKQEWDHNKSRLLLCNRTYPIAKVNAINYGPHSKNIESDKSAGLLKTLYLCKSAKVMLTSNLLVKHGLFNGAPGTVVDIIYLNGRKPPDNLPDIVMVHFDTYNGPSFVECDPKIVPIKPVERRLDCYCNNCRRTQVPLRLGWGTTIHRCQGMTIGEGESNRYIIIHPGTVQFEGRFPGALFVALSRAKKAGQNGGDPDFAWNPHVLVNEDRLRFKPNTNTTRTRAKEIQRISQLSVQTRNKFAHLTPDTVFRHNIEMISNLQEAIRNEP